MTRRPDIQGLRALAVLLVIVYHAGFPVPGGFTGVDVFFVISGFVITGTLLAELSSTGRLSLRRFYIRRIKRLLPALALVLVFVALVGTLANPAQGGHMAALTGLFASIFSANFYLAHLPTGYFDASTAINPLLHTWTLAVEEQFYIVFPTLLALGWLVGRSRVVRGRSRELSAAIIAVACIASFVLSYALTRGELMGGSAAGSKLAFYASPTRAWEFGLGALVVLGTPLISRLSIWILRAFGLVGAAAIVVAAFSLNEAHFRETAALIPVGGTCLLLAAGIGARAGISRLLSLRPAVWIGDLSYSLYLWHWPLIVFARALWPGHPNKVSTAAAALSLLPAWLSYRYVENPIRHHSSLGSRSRTAGRVAAGLASICILIPVGANFGLLGVQKAVNNTSSMKSWWRSQKLHADFGKGCVSTTPLGERRGDSCDWTVSRPRGEIVLLGDSNAGHFTEPVTRASNRAGFDAMVVTAPFCSYLGLRVKVAGAEIAGCARWGLATLNTLVRRKPSLVVLATRTDSYLLRPDLGLAEPGSHAFTFSAGAKANLWQQALESAVRRLNEAGVPVVLVHPVPGIPFGSGSCAVLSILTGDCAGTISRSAVDASLSSAIHVEDAAIATAPAAWALSFENEICGKESCSTVRDGVVQYRDPHHLSVDGALMLTDSFYKAIKAHAIERSHH